MLDTLNKYIENTPGGEPVSASLWSQYGKDERFKIILVVSIAAHVLFYAAVIEASILSMRRKALRAPKQVALTKITDVAPPLERFDLRTRPEPIERADITRLEYDPNRGDDVHLLSRSTKPSTARGAAGLLPRADEIERRLRASRGGGNTAAAPPKSQSPEPQPPSVSPIQVSRSPQPDAPAIAQLPSSQHAPTPPAPTRPNLNPSPPGAQDAPAGVRRGNSAESRALGLESSPGQYRALVRAKIRAVNESIMPRDWIRETLNDKVSADFSVSIRRDGRIAAAQLIRSSGYSVLDGKAREAIYNASPFEGFPQDAGDVITLTVTVFYTPAR